MGTHMFCRVPGSRPGEPYAPRVSPRDTRAPRNGRADPCGFLDEPDKPIIIPVVDICPDNIAGGVTFSAHRVTGVGVQGAVLPGPCPAWNSACRRSTITTAASARQRFGFPPAPLTWNVTPMTQTATGIRQRSCDDRQARAYACKLPGKAATVRSPGHADRIVSRTVIRAGTRQRLSARVWSRGIPGSVKIFRIQSGFHYRFSSANLPVRNLLQRQYAEFHGSGIPRYKYCFGTLGHQEPWTG